MLIQVIRAPQHLGRLSDQIPERHTAGVPKHHSFGSSFHPTYNPIVCEYYCYILECADGTLYTGMTTDPERRLQAHNLGRGSRYTRARRPLRLAYIEKQPDRKAAVRRERAIKSLPREQKLALITQGVSQFRSRDKSVS